MKNISQLKTYPKKMMKWTS